MHLAGMMGADETIVETRAVEEMCFTIGTLDHEGSLLWLLTLITRMVRTRAKPDEAPPVSPIHTVVDRIWILSPGYWKTVAILKEDIDKFLSKNCC